MGNSTDVLPPHDATLMTFQLLICIIGVTGNLMVIFVVLVLQEYKKAVTHWYVLQLAFADSVFLLSIPFKVSEDWNNEWIFSGGFCKVVESVLYLNYYSSVFFLMIMSIDRYIAVCHEFSKVQVLRSYRACYIITACVWVISLLLSLPVWLYSDKTGFKPNCVCRYMFPPEESFEEECSLLYEGDCVQKCIRSKENTPACDDFNDTHDDLEHCLTDGSGDYGDYDQGNDYYDQGNSSYDDKYESYYDNQYVGYNLTCTYKSHPKTFKTFVTYNFVALFLIPFVVMLACYTLIMLRLRKTRLRSASLTSGEYPTRKRSMSKTEKKLIRLTMLCGILVALFVVCWLPYQVALVAKIRGISGTDEFCTKLSTVLGCLAYSNSALNPYVYNFVGAKFLRRLRKASRVLGGRLKIISMESRSDRSGSMVSGGKIYRRSETKMTGYSSKDSSNKKGESSGEDIPMMTVSYKATGDAIEIAQG